MNCLKLKNSCPILSRCTQAGGRKYDMYIFSSDFLLTLNLRTFKRLSQALSDIVLTWYIHLHVLEKVRPRCLWLVVSSMMRSCISKLLKRKGAQMLYFIILNHFQQIKY